MENNIETKKGGKLGTTICCIILSFIITVGTSIYQKKTGPTYPKKIHTEINGNSYDFKFARSGGEQDQMIVLNGLTGKEVSANLHYRKYPTSESFTALPMNSTQEGFIGLLPVQPPAGKLEYFIEILVEKSSDVEVSREVKMLFKDDPLIIRFKGDVPAGILVPHILFMFISMFFASMALIYAIINRKSYKKHLIVSALLLFIGGFIFGPIVQKYAFGIYWSGFPFGTDLTDNKTLLAMIALLAAVCTIKYKWNRIVTILAVIVMYVVFSIPHSMRGSELNHETGVIETSNVE